MSYVDGFVLAVPEANLEAYQQMASTAGTVWMEHGARQFLECVAEDAPRGELTSFPRAVMANEDETVVLAFIRYDSREHRDAVVRKVMADPRMTAMMEDEPPFDGRRMIFGGFRSLVELPAPQA